MNVYTRGGGMYIYTWYQWMNFFFIYCFLGWCFESTYVSIRKKHFVNRGFLRLPMLPIYGFGAIILLFVSKPVQDNYLLMLLFGMAAATLLEYVTGAVMEALFKVKYWDYSNQKFNLHGYICLSSSFTWGIFAIILTKIIHQPIERAVFQLDENINIIIVIIVLCVFLSDVIVSVHAAWDIRKVIEKMTLLKEELEELEERLKQVSLEGRLRLEGLREEGKELFEEFKDNIIERSERFNKTKESLGKRIAELREEYRGTIGKMNSLKSSLIKGNPSASSKRFREAYEDLKKRFRKD